MFSFRIVVSDSAFRIPDSGFPFLFSGFRIPAFSAALHKNVQFLVCNQSLEIQKTMVAVLDDRTFCFVIQHGRHAIVLLDLQGLVANQEWKEKSKIQKKKNKKQSKPLDRLTGSLLVEWGSFYRSNSFYP